MKYILTVASLVFLSTLVFAQKSIEDVNGDYVNEGETISSSIYQEKSQGGTSLLCVNVIPSPISYPHDIAFDGEYLWIAGYGDYQLFQISMVDGAVIRSIPTDLQRPYGLTFDGQYLWVAGADLDIIQQVDTADGTVISTFNAPATVPSYSAGLAFDGINIWQNDQRDNSPSTPGDSTFVIDQTGNWVNGYEAMGDFPGGLAFDGTYLWSSDNDLDEIHKIDPTTFLTVETFDSPGNISLGLAFDGQYLWVADNGSDSLYQLDVGLALSNPTFGFENESISIYPNPSNHIVSIDLQANYQNIDILITDITGRIVQDYNFKDKELLEITLNSEEKGVRIFNIKADRTSFTYRVLIE